MKRTSPTAATNPKWEHNFKTLKHIDESSVESCSKASHKSLKLMKG